MALSVVDVSIEISEGRLMMVAPVSFAILDILLSSVDMITLSTNFDAWAYSMLCTISGFPANVLIFYQEFLYSHRGLECKLLL